VAGPDAHLVALLNRTFAVLTGPILPGKFNRRVALLPAACLQIMGLTVAGRGPKERIRDSSRSQTSPNQLGGGNPSSTLIGVEMRKSKSVHMFANVVADATASEAWGGGSVRDGDRLEPSPLTATRESACPPGCRVCFLARKYGLTPREVTLIALISSGKSGRAISQTLGIGMPTIRKYCGIIHDKIGTHSRLAIGLWAIREGMVTSVVQPESGCRVLDA
jgi:DNA-binding CsgD family transcriptional regulator